MATVEQNTFQETLREDITAKIAEAMEAGLPPWRKPWTNHPNAGFPANFITKKGYSGINPLLLQLTAMKRGFTSRWWGTFKQWQAVGLMVSKRPADVPSGQWGTQITFWKPVGKKKVDENGKESFYLVLRTYTVFNADQVGGPSVGKYRVPEDASIEIPQDYEHVEAMIAATKADIKHDGGNQAVYHRLEDRISLPARSRFESVGHYYSTTFHELVHWTESRLGWTGSYAMGELIAEIGSCYMESELRLPHCEDMTNHQTYIQDWLKALKNDPKAIFAAATQATKAVDYLLSFSRPQNRDEDAGGGE